MRNTLLTIITIVLIFIGNRSLWAQNEAALSHPISIIPTPQEINYLGGITILPEEIFLTFSHSNENTEFIKEEMIREFPQFKFEEGKQGRGKRQFRLIFDKIGSHERIGEQGYFLTVSERSIEIRACSDVGLFYGYQTLRQLLRQALLDFADAPQLSTLEITDFPALAYRGWMDDISRGPIPTVAFIKEQIRTLSAYKLNCMTLYTEHTYRASSGSEYAPEGSLTAEEIADIQAFAKRYHVEVIGNQQAFAHSEKILQHPKYKKLADTKYNFNPALEETYQFFDTLLSELSQTYHSSIFHINGDETDGLGTGTAKAFVDSIGGKQAAYLYHISRIGDILKRNGKRMMMWGDIIGHEPAAIRQLPEDVILVAWSYDAREDFREMLQPIQSSGREFFVAPGVSCWHTPFPDHHTYVGNIANLLRDGVQMGATGMLNTAWDDAGESLFTGTWHAQLWGAEMAWHPITSDETTTTVSQRLSAMNRGMNPHFFGRSTREPVWVERLLKIADFKFSPVNELTLFGAFWQPTYPFYPDQVKPELYDSITRRLERDYLPIRQSLNDPQAPQESPLWQYGKYACDRYLQTLKQHRLRILLHQVYAQGSTAELERRIRQEYSEIRDGYKNIQNAYMALWDGECRTHWRDVIEERFASADHDLNTIFAYPFTEIALTDSGTLQLGIHNLFRSSLPIYYTLDGSRPTLTSARYTQPITLTQSGTVQLLTLSDEGREVYVERSILLHKGMGHLTRLGTSFSTYRATYSGGGEKALGDGQRGTSYYNDGRWQGYQATDAEVFYDFKKATTINKVTVGYLQNFNDWILSPDGVEVYVSEDGKEFRQVAQRSLLETEKRNGIGALTLEMEEVQTRHLKIVVKNPLKLPITHPCAGSDAYIFLDEIVIE